MFIDLVTPSGQDLSIPASSIKTFESLRPGKNPHFPNASAFLRFDFGTGPLEQLVSTPFDDIEKVVFFNAGGQGRWLKVSHPDGDQLRILKEDVRAYSTAATPEVVDEGDDTPQPKTVIQLALPNGQIAPFNLAESVEDVRKQLK